MYIRIPELLAYVAIGLGLVACSSSDPGVADPSSGGTAVQTGGSPANGQGGAVQGGAAQGGANATGGLPSNGGQGGSPSTGSASTGGANLGGSATGGNATGGAPLGGNSNGGNATGGKVVGGASAGGNTTGGKATGGSNLGGSAMGGNATGGADSNVGGATGGAAAGGAATGGRAAGGAAAGGAATGGTATGGTATGIGGNGGQCSGSGEYSWPPYSPTVAYDYQDEYGTIAMPTAVSNDVSGIAGTYADQWWSFIYGGNKNSLVTSAAWIPMVSRFNADFTYITDTMRWPRDGRVRGGHKSAIYLYGSGLSTDSASNTAKGGWQSGTTDGPNVLASYYPVYSFDPACTYSDKVAQQGAMIHEGIHCILASMPGCKKASWFHEGGNTWLQATMEAKRSGTTPASMGWLSAGAAIAPFMPIETYTGWLLDGTFGGPAAERVNQYSGSQQLCSWRKLLGGTQYGECFPHAMEVILGEKSIAWVWRNASKSGRVLQDLAEVTGGLGAAQTRRLIQEFRARQAFGDFGKWKAAYKKLLNDNWGASLACEWTPCWIDGVAAWTASSYVNTTQSGSTLTPDALTLPGWSGANQIPLTLNSGATCASVTFNPTGANMSCQLVYQDSSGNPHYGTPVTSGECSAPVANVKNNVVIAVISNTNYIYDGGTTKYGYTLTLGTGISGKAAITTKWYQ